MPYTPFYAGEVVTAEALGTRIIEIVMDWTPLVSLGNFQSGFSPNPAKPPRMQIRRTMGTLEFLYEGRINNSGTNMVNTTAVMFVFTVADCIPSVEHGDEVYGANSSHQPIRLGLLANGNLTGSVAAGSANPSTIWLDDTHFTNPK
ncbi:hypothetical protein HHL19_36440 [Streptomyces sp. R302]|uniref:hypothetical protein n=1 Tax=unclassified Streptomyces TaxID=2593676 RepID=UPI00145D516E|nr:MULTISPECIES: hypothetical protein [unclassified Streptomyces]NML55657.1 hypothetical protein [Streptomyces sp. R301]NML84001.1 hypothetical protein [Streptomyces sp. R302]